MSTKDLAALFEVDDQIGGEVAPSWNVAPTQLVRIVAERSRTSDATAGPRRQLFPVRWGLVPHWAKDAAIGTRMINARSETVTVKPAFKSAAARRRCLVPADGYYEWSGERGSKTPYLLHDPDNAVLALAGLFEVWRDRSVAEDDPAHLRWTCTIITRQAPDSLGHVHDRSPVVVPADLRDSWLDCSDDDARYAGALLDRMPPPRLVPREVGRAVGNVRNNGPQLIEPVTD